MFPSRNDMLMQRRRGFTLIEMLAVVLIMALLATAAGGLYAGSARRRQAEQCCRKLALMMRYARMWAVENSTPCAMKLDRSKCCSYLSVRIRDESTGYYQDKTMINRFTRPVYFPEHLPLKEVVVQPADGVQTPEGSDVHAITFYPEGTADGSVIYLGDETMGYTITVSAITGRITVQQGLVAPQTEVVDLEAS